MGQGLGCCDALIVSVFVSGLCLVSASKAGGCCGVHRQGDGLSSSRSQLPQVIGGNGSRRQDSGCCFPEAEGRGKKGILSLDRQLAVIDRSLSSNLHQFLKGIAFLPIHAVSLLSYFKLIV